MPSKSVEYRVYRNGKSKAVLPNEAEAYDYLKTSSSRHKKADFVIEKREVVFNSHDSVADKNRLADIRKPDRTNSIHASIHQSNWDIGRE